MCSKQQVFISYAWESDEYRKEIWELAGWIVHNAKSRGLELEIITDHLHTHRPPETGWYRWMQDVIAHSDIVLLACSKSYKNYFLGRDNDPNRGGYGVTYEGSIITAELVKGKGVNKKFFPILPDGGPLSAIPESLVSYFSGIYFSSGNERILNLIIGENPIHEHRTGESTGKLINAKTESKAIIALETEIVNEIIEKVDAVNTEDTQGNYDVQVLLRAFFALNDVEKRKVVKENVSDMSAYTGLSPYEFDKEFLSGLDSQDKLYALWNSINKIRKLAQNENPFKSHE